MNEPLNHDTAKAKLGLTADFFECFFHSVKGFFASFKFDFVRLSIDISDIAVKAQQITDAKVVGERKVVIEFFKLLTADFSETI